MRRGALIGFGNVARHGHLPGWQRRADVELVAVADIEGGRRQDAAARIAGARLYESAEALLAGSALDFVDICTPPSTHAALIQAALERGVHVLCEKPLVGSLGDLRVLARLAASRQRVLHTVHNWHHAPIVRRTRQLIADGAVGQITGVVWQTLRTRPAAVAGPNGNWRVDPALAGGGVLTDHGWHASYIVRRWIGQIPLAVSASLETRRHCAFAVEDTANLQITFPTAKADIFLTWAADERRNWAEVSGTTGVLQLHDDTIVWQSRRTGEERRWECPPSLSDGSQHPDWFDAVAADFLAALPAPDASRSNLAEAPHRTTSRSNLAAPHRTASRSNLAEAWYCAALEAAARASSEQAGRVLPVEAFA
jgi:predicted dehydrogenase